MYIKREDAIKAFADSITETVMEDLGIKHGKQILYELHCDDVSNILVGIPSADVVEVVRCKVCKSKKLYSGDEGTSYYYCDITQNTVDEWNYCCWGERSTDE